MEYETALLFGGLAIGGAIGFFMGLGRGRQDAVVKVERYCLKNPPPGQEAQGWLRRFHHSMRAELGVGPFT